MSRKRDTADLGPAQVDAAEAVPVRGAGGGVLLDLDRMHEHGEGAVGFVRGSLVAESLKHAFCFVEAVGADEIPASSSE